MPAFTNLTPRQAGEVQASLASAKIPSKLGGAERHRARARRRASTRRASRSTRPASPSNGEHQGYDLLDKLGMSSTDFQQNVAMKRALEGELENQIQNISGVSDATVNLAMPQQTLFLADQKQATASVLLTLDGSRLQRLGRARRAAAGRERRHRA